MCPSTSAPVYTVVPAALCGARCSRAPAWAIADENFHSLLVELCGNRRLAQQAEKLNLVSPLATLQRGYAIASNNEGSVITSTTQVSPEQELHLKVSDGEIQVAVLK